MGANDPEMEVKKRGGRDIHSRFPTFTPKDWRSIPIEMIRIDVMELLNRMVHHHEHILLPLWIAKTRLKTYFNRIHYLGPLREIPDTSIHGRATIQKVLDGMEKRWFPPCFHRAGFNSARIDEQDTRMATTIGFWLIPIVLNPFLTKRGVTNFYVTKHKGGPEVRFTDVGFGVSQVLPVLILCYRPPEGSILIIEQPEAHLHPKVHSRSWRMFSLMS